MVSFGVTSLFHNFSLRQSRFWRILLFAFFLCDTQLGPIRSWYRRLTRKL
jgi:hypothetical protein